MMAAMNITPEEMAAEAARMDAATGDIAYMSPGNVNLPSLHQVMSDPEFRQTLESDGLPLLFSRAPRWPWDPDHLRRLTSQMPGGSIIMQFCQNNKEQRQHDAAFKHALLLIDRQGDTVRPAVEWPPIILEPAGITVPPVAKLGPCTASKFFNEIHGQQQFLDNAGKDCPPEAKLCKRCNAITTCECACGEHFCSRSCLKKAWNDHGPTCWMVFDNGRIASTVHNNFEYDPDERGPQAPPKRNKLRCKTCDKKGPKQKCAKCDTYYCSRHCQRIDWNDRNHKHSCTGRSS